MLKSISMVIMLLLWPCMAFAAHPLMTDDAGTQGKGNIQLEVNGQYDRGRETVGGTSVKSTGGQAGATLSYGIVESADFVLNVPYLWGTVWEDGLSVYDDKGFSDVVFEVKWHLFEKDGLNLALKPGISIPTGNDERGLGAGRTGYSLFLIGSNDAAPWTVHGNFGYIRNGNNADEEKNNWHISVATTYAVAEDLQILANIGAERNTDKTTDNDPAFLIAGIIYSVAENLDVDFGVQYGLTKSEADYSLLAGLTRRI